MSSRLRLTLSSISTLRRACLLSNLSRSHFCSSTHTKHQIKTLPSEFHVPLWLLSISHLDRTMAPLSDAVATYKQKTFDNAALEAMKAYDGTFNLPSRAMLNASDKAIIAQNPRQFNVSQSLQSYNECITKASLVQPLERTAELVHRPMLRRRARQATC